MLRTKHRETGVAALAVLAFCIVAPGASAATTITSDVDGSQTSVTGSSGADQITAVVIPAVGWPSVPNTLRVQDPGGVTVQNACTQGADTTVGECPVRGIASIYGGAGGDTIDFSYQAGAARIELLDLNGLDGNDTIYGSDKGESIGGGLGDDTIDGRGGTDFINCGDGNDTAILYAGDTRTSCESSGGGGGSPSVTSAGHSSRHLTASWTLPAGAQTFLIEAATSPATDVDGFFPIATTVLYEELLSAQTTYTAPVQLPAGTYYFHVASYEPSSPACAFDPYAVDCVLTFSSPPSVVTIPADPTPPLPPPPPSPAPSPAPDTVTAFASLSARSKQDVDKLFVSVAMGEAGTLTAGGSVSVPGASKVFKFKTAKANAVAGVAVRLKLKLPARALKAVKKALKKKKKIKAKLTITAKDTAGNTKVSKRTVALKP